MANTDVQLRQSGSVTLDANGNGTVTLGPLPRGPAYWHVTGLIAQTTRVVGGQVVSAGGLAPIPKFQVYRNQATADNSLGLTYDGSFTTAQADEQITRGETLLFVWTGGAANDIATVVVTGTMH
jgi:hypothetical protein